MLSLDDQILQSFFEGIYWSDVGRARTERASLEGEEVQALNMSWAVMNTYGAPTTFSALFQRLLHA